MPSNWHAHEADSAHAVDRGNLRSVVRLDRDPGRRPLLGHPRGLQAHLGAERLCLSATPGRRDTGRQSQHLDGQSGIQQHGRTGSFQNHACGGYEHASWKSSTRGTESEAQKGATKKLTSEAHIESGILTKGNPPHYLGDVKVPINQ